MIPEHFPIGTRFRFERELRQISLIELSRNLHLPVSKLIDFEENRMVPDEHGLYFKTFVNGYIRYLGLDPECIDLEIRYCRSVSRQSGEVATTDSASRSQRFFPFLGFLITLAVLLAGIALYPSYTEYQDTVKTNQLPQESVLIRRETALEAFKIISDQNIHLGKSEKESDSVTELNVPVGHAISLSADTPVWIRASYPHEGRDIMEIILPGETRLFSTRQAFYLEIGVEGSAQLVVPDMPVMELASGIDRFHFLPG